MWILKLNNNINTHKFRNIRQIVLNNGNPIIPKQKIRIFKIEAHYIFQNRINSFHLMSTKIPYKFVKKTLIQFKKDNGWNKLIIWCIKVRFPSKNNQSLFLKLITLSLSSISRTIFWSHQLWVAWNWAKA